MRRFWFLALGSVLSGCGTLYAPASTSVPLAQTTYESRPADYPIALLTTTLPRCAYEEIATASAFPPMMAAYAKPDTLLALLRSEARKAGGDAVVRVREVTEDDHDVMTGQPQHVRHYTGTVIRYRDAACRD